jgi:hypothetical protein
MHSGLNRNFRPGFALTVEKLENSPSVGILGPGTVDWPEMRPLHFAGRDEQLWQMAGLGHCLHRQWLATFVPINIPHPDLYPGRAPAGEGSKAFSGCRCRYCAKASVIRATSS